MSPFAWILVAFLVFLVFQGRLSEYAGLLK